MSDSIDNDIGPESGSVLADAPTLVLEFAFTFGDFERPRRTSSFLIFLGVKSREVLTNDLSRAVALEALRAGVPACDDASRIQHIDRVIRYCLDQQLITPGF